VTSHASPRNEGKVGDPLHSFSIIAGVPEDHANEIHVLLQRSPASPAARLVCAFDRASAMPGESACRYRRCSFSRSAVWERPFLAVVAAAAPSDTRASAPHGQDFSATRRKWPWEFFPFRSRPSKSRYSQSRPWWRGEGALAGRLADQFFPNEGAAVMRCRRRRRSNGASLVSFATTSWFLSSRMRLPYP